MNPQMVRSARQGLVATTHPSEKTFFSMPKWVKTCPGCLRSTDQSPTPQQQGGDRCAGGGGGTCRGMCRGVCMGGGVRGCVRECVAGCVGGCVGACTGGCVGGGVGGRAGACICTGCAPMPISRARLLLCPSELDGRTTGGYGTTGGAPAEASACEARGHIAPPPPPLPVSVPFQACCPVPAPAPAPDVMSSLASKGCGNNTLCHCDEGVVLAQGGRGAVLESRPQKPSSKAVLERRPQKSSSKHILMPSGHSFAFICVMDARGWAVSSSGKTDSRQGVNGSSRKHGKDLRGELRCRCTLPGFRRASRAPKGCRVPSTPGCRALSSGGPLGSGAVLHWAELRARGCCSDRDWAKSRWRTGLLARSTGKGRPGAGPCALRCGTGPAERISRLWDML